MSFQYRRGFWLIALCLFSLAVSPANGQNEVINNVRDALKTGSSRELSTHFNNTVEISINGEKASYSRNQAEFVLKDFFSKYPPQGFRYVHQGSSKEGLKYTVGTYTHDRGEFRVFMLIKQFGSSYMVDKIDFNQE
ncbi:MAG: DUF4783 domain-containing protein [Tunicatimonas sp.]